MFQHMIDALAHVNGTYERTRHVLVQRAVEFGGILQEVTEAYLDAEDGTTEEDVEQAQDNFTMAYSALTESEREEADLEMAPSSHLGALTG